MSETRADHEDSAFLQLLERTDFIEGSCWKRRTYRDGTTILSEGSSSGKVYVVLQGCTRILGQVAVGSDYNVRPGLRDLGPGEIFGEMSLLDSEPHAASVLAVGECELAVIDGPQLLAYLDQNRAVGYMIFKEISQRLVDRLRKTDKQMFALLAWGLKAHGYEKYMSPS